MPDNIRLAVLGLGRLETIHAENLSHHTNGVQLVCIVDPFCERAKQVAKELGGRTMGKRSK